MIANLLGPLEVDRTIVIYRELFSSHLYVYHLPLQLCNQSLSLSLLSLLPSNDSVLLRDLLRLPLCQSYKGSLAIVTIEGLAWMYLLTVVADQVDFRAVIDEVRSHASTAHEKVLTRTV